MMKLMKDFSTDEVFEAGCDQFSKKSFIEHIHTICQNSTLLH